MDKILSDFSSLVKKSRGSLLLFSILFLFMFAYEIYDHWTDARENARIAARSLIKKDISYRKWNALHGGVYVPVTEKTPPNPYLIQVPERDIETPSGRKLTLVNPAYMTRQVHELESFAIGMRGHITSLRLLRPENRPDNWESEALKAFEKGKTEVSSVEIHDGTKCMRVMHPLATDKACLKCHAFQGYREGDIRGGVGVSIPMKPYYSDMYWSITSEGLIYLTCWAIGAGLILSHTRREEKRTIDLRNSEERNRNLSNQFTALLDAIPDSITLISPDYKILWANRAAGERIDRASESMLGEYCYDLWFKGTEPCEKCLIMECFKSGLPSEKYVMWNDRKIEVRAVPIIGNEGVINVIRVGRDVTEQYRLEEQLRQSQKMEAIGTLAGGIAHDFNNVMTAIIGFGTMAKRRHKDDPTSQEFIKEILDGANRAAELTRGLLAFSRKQALSPKLHDLNSIIGNMEKMLRRIIGEDIEFSTVLNSKDIMVMVDAAQIDQVLLNLATNARDAMPNGGHLIIKTDVVDIDDGYPRMHLLESTGKYAVLTISDTGTGMDLKTKENIFEPFFTTKDVGKGTGLGLAMVYGIIRQHGGNINVYSEPGQGTTFRIYLPIANPVADEEIPENVGPITSGKGEMILIAEDEAQVRKIIKFVLEGGGYNVIEAENGKEAVRKFRENMDKVSLIILDVIMPLKNGRDAYEDIKVIRPDIKAIFMSGYTDDIIAKKGILEAGFDFIPKPIDPNMLLRKIKEVLDI